MSSSNLDFPFRVDVKGKAATTDADDHIRDMIYQVLFTSSGERVNRPDFGCGLLQMVFMPNSDLLATATQFLVQGSLQHWLSDVIEVEKVEISNQEERLAVEVVYTRLDNGQKMKDSFSLPAFGK
ncbi:MAG: GPW/gp25 family protein [Methanothrix sp.]